MNIHTKYNRVRGRDYGGITQWMLLVCSLKSAPARVTLGVTTLLAMSTTMASIQKSLPPVAYMKVRQAGIVSL